MTDPEDASLWERAKAAFDEAAGLQGEARADFLQRMQRNDPQVAAEVRSLLDQHEGAGDFLGDPTIPAEELLQTTQPAEDPVPERVGRYVVRRRLGAGGMGQVLLAHDPQLERDVALKLLPEALARDPERRERFLREARAVARLSHPHVAALHEVGEADGRDYLAFEFVDGGTLGDRIARGPLDLGELLTIAIPLARALESAHEQGVVHRDVKAGNVMLDSKGRPKLVDFGLARRDSNLERADFAHQSTEQGRVLGTPGAMSPEQAVGEAVDHRTDVFSFGSLLYAMATGREPFKRKTAIRTLSAVVHETPGPLSELRPDLPASLVTLIEQSMEKDANRRPQFMKEVADELERIRRNPDEPQHLEHRAPSRALALWLLAALLLALVWRFAVPRQGPGLAAVLYVENLDDSEDRDRLGDMVAQRLAIELASGGLPNMLSSQRIHDVALQVGADDGRIDARTATEVAKRADLQTMIVGSLRRMSGELELTAELIDVDSGRSLGGAECSGQEEDLFRMVVSLGNQLRAVLDVPSLDPAERRAIDDGLTDSVEAWRAYVNGQDALQRGWPSQAADEFARATAMDPAFALAHFRRAMALTWTGDEAATNQALERANAYRGQLPEDVRMLLDATGPYFRDDTSAALPQLLEVLEDDPSHKDALFMVGEIYTHSATRNDAARADEVYTRLLELDPDYSVVYGHALTARLRQADREAARELLDEWEVRAPGTLHLLVGTMALWEGRLEDATECFQPRPAEGEAGDLEALLAIELLASDRTNPRVSAVLKQDVPQLVEQLADRQGLRRVVALDLRANALALYGRLEDAEALYRLAGEVSGFQSTDGFLTNARSGSRHRLSRLLALRDDLPAARREVNGTLAVQPESPRCLLESVRLSLAEGDAERAAADLATLAAVSQKGWSPATPYVLQLAEAEVALAAGRASEARIALEELLASDALMLDWGAHEDSIAPLVRDSLARACLAEGDAQAAAAAWDGLLAAGLERLRHPVLWVNALGERARLADAAGDPVQAAAFATRLLGHWGDAQPAPRLVAELSERGW